MDAIQKEFECCGVNNISDWKKPVPNERDLKIPKSCCKPSVTSCKEVPFAESVTLSNYFEKVSLKYGKVSLDFVESFFV